MTVGEKINEYITDQRITQVRLASDAEIAPAKLNLALNGKRRLTLEEYESICWALGVPVDKFLSPHPPVRQ